MLHPTAEFRFKYGRFLEAAIRSEGYCRRDRENREGEMGLAVEIGSIGRWSRGAYRL